MSLHIRYATAADATALDRLAQLDSSVVPSAPQIIAEQDGHLIAAVSAGDGTAIADPFTRTADTVKLLHRRARQLDNTRRSRRLVALRLTSAA